MAVLDEQERDPTELQRLKAENKQLAQFQSENLARQSIIQGKLRKLEHLEVKKFNTARAWLKFYDQLEEKFEATDLLHNVEPAELHVLNPTSSPFISQSLPVTMQALHASSLIINLQVRKILKIQKTYRSSTYGKSATRGDLPSL